VSHLPEHSAESKTESLALLFGMTGFEEMSQTFCF
jgi:hypothetical protein